METTKVNVNKANTFTVRQKIAYFSDHITTVCHVLIIWYVLYTWYAEVQAGGWDFSNMSLHITLYVTGWSLLMLEGIMAISPNNVITRHVSPTNRARIHTVLQIMSAPFCLAGFFILYSSRSRHFQSTHSKTGVASLALTLLTVLNGLSALFAGRLKRFISPGLNKVFHAVFGITTFVVGTVSLYYGIEYGFYRNRIGVDTARYMKAILLFTLIWSMVTPLLNCFERIRYMF